MRCWSAALLVVVNTSVPLHAAELQRSAFAYGATLTVPGNAALYEVELPFTVYTKTRRTDLGDLRVFNASGEVVPHAFAPPPAARLPLVDLPSFPLRGDATQIERIALRIEKSGAIVSVDADSSRPGVAPIAGYVLDARTVETPMQALMLEWSDVVNDYTGRVRVEASDDLVSWRTIADAVSVLRLAYDGRTLEQRRVAFAPQRAKFLRLTWASRQPALVVTHVKAEPEDARASAERRWQPAQPMPSREPGEYAFDLGGVPPVDRLRVELPQPNTVVPVQILTRAKAADPWRVVYSGTVYRLLHEGETLTNPDIDIPATATRDWLLRVDTRGGGVGGAPPSLRAGWTPARLVFVARGDGPFEIAYGSATVPPNGLSIASIVPGYEATTSARERPTFTIAAAAEPHTLGGEAKLGPPVDWKTSSLWTALVLAVAALGFMAWRLSQQAARGSDSSQTAHRPP